MKEDLIDQAKLLILSQNYEEAKKILEKLLKEGNYDPEILYHLGIIEEVLSNYEKAKDFYKKVIEIKPDHKEAKKRLSLLEK